MHANTPMQTQWCFSRCCEFARSSSPYIIDDVERKRHRFLMAVLSRNPYEALLAAAAVDPRGQSRMETVFEGHRQSPRAKSATWGRGGSLGGDVGGGAQPPHDETHTHTKSYPRHSLMNKQGGMGRRCPPMMKPIPNPIRDEA